MVKVEEKDLAYLAGFFDGEGYIGIIPYTSRKDLKDRVWYLRLSVSNTDRGVLEWVSGIFGGNVIDVKRNPRGRTKPIYHWGVYSQQAFDILQAIRPYLITKAAEADIGLRFHLTMLAQKTKWKAYIRGKRVGPERRMPDEFIKARRDLAEEIIALRNSRKTYLVA